MKKGLLLILVAIVLSGCFPQATNSIVKCNKNIDSVKSFLTTIFINEGYSLKTQTPKIMVFTGDGSFYNVWNGLHNMTWNINFKNDTLIFKPFYVDKTLSFVVGDEFHKGLTEYWNIRSQIENYCDCKIKTYYE